MKLDLGLMCFLNNVGHCVFLIILKVCIGVIIYLFAQVVEVCMNSVEGSNPGRLPRVNPIFALKGS